MILFNFIIFTKFYEAFYIASAASGRILDPPKDVRDPIQFIIGGKSSDIKD